jgi:hypothetical protein
MIGNEVHIMMRWKKKRKPEENYNSFIPSLHYDFNREFNFSQRFSPHKLQLNVISGYRGGRLGMVFNGLKLQFYGYT